MTAPKVSWATKVTGLAFSLPQGTHFTTCVAAQYLVLEPAFEVSIDDLYELPSCYMPIGTRACTQTVSCVNDYAWLIQSQIGKCASTRKAIETERIRLEELKAEEERLRAEEEKKERLRLQEARRQAAYKELIRKAETGLEEIRETAFSIVTMAGPRLLDVLHTDTPYQIFDTVKWVQNYLLACAVVAYFKQQGSIPGADDEQVNAVHLKLSIDLVKAVNKVLASFQHCLPTIQSSTILRDMIGLTAKQSDPFVFLTHMPRWPTWEDFVPDKKEITELGVEFPISQDCESAVIKSKPQISSPKVSTQPAHEEPAQAEEPGNVVILSKAEESTKAADHPDTIKDSYTMPTFKQSSQVDYVSRGALVRLLGLLSKSTGPVIDHATD